MGPAKGAMSATIESGAAARSADDPLRACEAIND
jgi:hypothetical protein